MTLGDVIAMGGGAIALICCGVAASVGMSWVQQAAAGVISEEPEKYGKTMILQLIPSSNALYGFVVCFLVVAKVIFGVGGFSIDQGLMVFVMCLPIAIVGAFACLAQAKVCVSGVVMVGKRVELSGRALTMSVFIELFALFALIISVLGVLLI